MLQTLEICMLSNDLINVLMLNAFAGVFNNVVHVHFSMANPI